MPPQPPDLPGVPPEAPPRLTPRAEPSQPRANRTVERILDTAATLLEQAGFEELTTNKICRAAGLTPPALYRYFPNKYAVVAELAKRLMQAQNQAVIADFARLAGQGLSTGLAASVLAGQIRITRDSPGGVAVLRTMYATPQLVAVRLTSHDDLTEAMTSALEPMDLGPRSAMGRDELRRRVRLMIEIGNSVIEMIVENPQMDEAAMVADTAALMVALLRGDLPAA